MNRVGLAIALAVGLIVGVIFGVRPELDRDIALFFFVPAAHTFVAVGDWVGYARDAATLIVALLIAPAGLALLGKVVAPRRRILMPGRAALFLSVTLAVGPFFLANVVLKNHWARMRPVDVVQFGGSEGFTPWWDPRGPCPENCSFIAGEPSSAFWTLAPAALTPPQWRPLAYSVALLFGCAVAVLRMASGAHFFSDVAFAGVFMFIVVWTLHGLVYRWRRTRLSDAAVELSLEQSGWALRHAFAALQRRLRGGASKRL
jgi:lipid A 4'-phosphatase